MQKLLELYGRLPGFIRNKYFVTILLFGMWMLFFDDYNVINQFRSSKELRAIKAKRDFYLDETVKANQEKKELFSNSDNLEKYARENYYMKRDNEDIFIIEETK